MKDPIRTFIALPLTEEIHHAIADLQSELKGKIPDARWTRSEGIHLTLKFLGKIEKLKIAGIKRAIEDVAKKHSTFELNLNGVGAFPRLAAPRVLWIGMDRSDQLLQLQRDIEASLEALGFSPEKRTYSGHLTLARLKGNTWSEDRRRLFLESGQQMEDIRLPANRVILFESDLRPEGAVYTPLHSSLLNDS